MTLHKDIEEALNTTVTHISPLSGGCVGEVFDVILDDGRRCVVKTGTMGCGLYIEAQMLVYLMTLSPITVPDVLYADECLLIMEKLENDEQITHATEIEAADEIAKLHSIKASEYGLPFDTLIGGLAQSNTQTSLWLEFYRDERLFNMAHQALQAGNLPDQFIGRIEKLAYKLPEIAPEAKYPALLHGDLWGGNILSHKGKLTGFIDPAIYYGHPEMDLAFSTLFNTFGNAFFARYQEHHKLEPDFFEERKDLYNLYPLLVHVRLFGGSYVGDVDRTLAKFGC